MKHTKLTNSSTRKPVILAVFAHPDDESFLAGGTLAYYASNGVEVKLLCLTHGEAGFGENATEYERQILPQVRQSELARCCEILGIQLLPLLDFPDGRLSEFATSTLAMPIASAIRKHSPEIVLTFGADALTRHPDHLAIHHAATLAFQEAALPGMALFYAGLSEGALSRLSTRLEGSLNGLPLKLTAAQGIELDTVINTEEVSELKWSALACHRTQAAGLQDLTTRDHQILGQQEFFRLKKIAGAYPVAALRNSQSGPCATDLFDRISFSSQLQQIA